MARKKKQSRSKTRADIGIIPVTAITQLAGDYGWGRAASKAIAGNASGAIAEVRIPGGIPGLIGDCLETGIAATIYKATPKFKVNVFGFKIHS